MVYFIILHFLSTIYYLLFCNRFLTVELSNQRLRCRESNKPIQKVTHIQVSEFSYQLKFCLVAAQNRMKVNQHRSFKDSGYQIQVFSNHWLTIGKLMTYQSAKQICQIYDTAFWIVERSYVSIIPAQLLLFYKHIRFW